MRNRKQKVLNVCKISLSSPESNQDISNSNLVNSSAHAFNNLREARFLIANFYCFFFWSSRFILHRNKIETIHFVDVESRRRRFLVRSMCEWVTTFATDVATKRKSVGNTSAEILAVW